jgi:hypothetical protein
LETHRAMMQYDRATLLGDGAAMEIASRQAAEEIL